MAQLQQTARNNAIATRITVGKQQQRGVSALANLPAKVSEAPLRGPVPKELVSLGLEEASRIGPHGRVEEAAVVPTAFEAELREFQRCGQASDPSDLKRDEVLGLIPGRRSVAASDYYSIRAAVRSQLLEDGKQGSSSHRQRKKLRRKEAGVSRDPADIEGYQGSWGPSTTEGQLYADLTSKVAVEMLNKTASSARNEQQQQFGGLVSSNPSVAPLNPVALSTVPTDSGSRNEGAVLGALLGTAKKRQTTIFHGDAEVDYQGRSWLTPSPLLKRRDEDQSHFPPTRVMWTFTAHSHAVNSIRWTPDAGHMVLTASADGKTKMWDYEKRKCMRSYLKHVGGVREANFTSSNALRFVSCGDDQTVVEWDTEMGQIVSAIDVGTLPACVSVHPRESWSVIVGGRNKKALQYDLRSGKLVQEYSEHIGPVNTVTFIQNGDKFLTTAADRKMLVWEYGISVVVKHIADPAMHSMPAVVASPDGASVACQSLDNQILVWDVSDRIYQRHNRRFRGHRCGGYAIRPGFSPDTSRLACGDVTGKILFWDWTSGKLTRTLDKAFDACCIDVEWHPHHASRLASCSLNGHVKVWE